VLASSKAREVVAFIDASFSGTGDRSSSPLGTVPLKRLRDPDVGPRVALFQAGASGEIAALSAGAGGLFTRYVTEGLETARADYDGDGQITLQELHAWVSPRVSRGAKRDNVVQTPTLLLGSSIGPAAGFTIASGLSLP
jgi:hypothetical protein